MAYLKRLEAKKVPFGISSTTSTHLLRIRAYVVSWLMLRVWIPLKKPMLNNFTMRY
ncbi:hypothetical protein FOQG_19068 [Fusarium oxysporum f. sp. raphani 54005]|uniref:Uncharacterized protein n=1 Tax=Fusarium oxysporum f. sp. raphani 54005 TaxID=1089458 RepID=X0BBK3_FUSOX|nr:hypothetical protein FOQG_19068 [Fusarium oxysporum f. sp. raphani 54005]